MTVITEYWLKNKKLKPATFKCYMIILKKANGGKEPETVDFLKDYKTVLDRISELALTTQRSYLICIVSLLQSTAAMDEEKDIYYEKLTELNFQYNKSKENYEKTEKEEERMCSLEELKLCANYWFELLDEVIYNSHSYSEVERIYKMALIALLYTEIPPIRLEWATFIYIHNEDDIEEGKNYILNREGKLEFILQNYKTSNKYNTKVFYPTILLNNIILDWMSYSNSDFLFPSQQDDTKHMSQNSFGKLIPKAFESTGRKITLNILRHIYISHHVDPDVLDKNQELSEAMCHNQMTQRQYIRK